MTDRLTETCEECGSAYFGGVSAMVNLCPDCAHHLYGYPNCDHRFESGQCVVCGWDGSRSQFVARLIS
ncbi:MAG: hypothetical protein E5Y89_04340 [Mesorhizobium sp.]|nr:hypothetical protein EN745_28420 [Mesorhizobium sp. M4A.F.Ca.ET.022.05.2.1]RVD69180.1 hypothetical protein EN751_27365 [Mesorhizobium sp. M4A.F.Ca.ET.029.04.2.1]TIL82618.1 MAG: hypothetical protein E5Y89_04340 [Mesorhizobium sp.]TIW35320.1 MAG: hypothetical protein E5V62_11750 [Mesorhizobium sp.]